MRGCRLTSPCLLPCAAVKEEEPGAAEDGGMEAEGEQPPAAADGGEEGGEAPMEQ